MYKRQDVGHPVGQERAGVDEVVGRRREQADVARPPQALVAGGGVGGDGEEVASLAPGDIAHQLVEHGVRGLQGAGGREVGSPHDALDVGERRRLVHSGDLDVAEPVLCEGGLVGHRSGLGEGVAVGDLGAAEVVGVEGAVLVEHLRVPDLGCLPGGAGQGQPRHADHVLTEVVDVGSGGGLGPLPGLEHLGPAHGLVALRDEESGPGLQARGGFPLRVVESWPAPARRLQTGVIGLAVLQVGLDVGSVRRLPRTVRGDPLGRAVGVGDAHLCHQRGGVPVLAAPAQPDLAGPPAFRQGRADHVVPACQQLRHVVGLGLDALVVVRPARREHLVPDRLAVDLQLVEAECRGVDPCGGDLLAGFRREVLAQQRLRPDRGAVEGVGGAGHREGGVDDLAAGERVPSGREVGVEQSAAVRAGHDGVVDRSPFAATGMCAETDVALRERGVREGADQLAVERRLDGGAHHVVADGVPVGEETCVGEAVGREVHLLNHGVVALDLLVQSQHRGRARDAELPHVPVAHVGGAQEHAEGGTVEFELDRGGVVGPLVQLTRSFRTSDPLGIAPVAGFQQTCLEVRVRAPPARSSLVVPGPDAPVVARGRLQFRTAVPHADLAVGLHLAGRPGIGRTRRASDLDLVGLLRRRPPGRRQLPTEDRLFTTDTHRVHPAVGGQSLHGERRVRRRRRGGHRRRHARHARHDGQHDNASEELEHGRAFTEHGISRI